jgi:hypothetical protein
MRVRNKRCSRCGAAKLGSLCRYGCEAFAKPHSQAIQLATAVRERARREARVGLSVAERERMGRVAAAADPIYVRASDDMRDRHQRRRAGGR